MKFLVKILATFTLAQGLAYSATFTVSNDQIQDFTALHDPAPYIGPPSPFGTLISATGIEQGANQFGVPYFYDEVGLFGHHDLSAYDSFSAVIGPNGFGSGERPIEFGITVRDLSGGSTSHSGTLSFMTQSVDITGLDRSNISFVGIYLLGHDLGAFNDVLISPNSSADVIGGLLENDPPVSAVPLPAAFYLFITALAGLFRFRQ